MKNPGSEEIGKLEKHLQANQPPAYGSMPEIEPNSNPSVSSPSGNVPGVPTVSGRLEKLPPSTAPEEEGDLSTFQKFMWFVIGLFCAVWIVIPEPTDLIPFFGWIDEFLAATGLAGILLVTALRKLGIKIPFIDPLIHRLWRRKHRK